MNHIHNFAGRSITRREFVKDAATGSLALALGLSTREGFSAEPLFSAAKPQSKLVLIRNEKAVSKEGEVDAKVVASMLDEAMAAFTGKKGKDAWTRFIKPEDTVGMKITRCQWQRIPTEQAVVDAIKSRLTGASVPEDKINADDYGLPLDKWKDYAKHPEPQFPNEDISHESYDPEKGEWVEGVFLAGWAREDLELSHVMFGSVQVYDGKPLKRRSGENI